MHQHQYPCITIAIVLHSKIPHKMSVDGRLVNHKMCDFYVWAYSTGAAVLVT